MDIRTLILHGKKSSIIQMPRCEFKIHVFTLHESSCDSFGDGEPQIE